MILLMFVLVCASANNDVETLVDGIWRLVPAEPKTASPGEGRQGMQFAKLTMDNINRCPPGVRYSEHCDNCIIECHECYVFNEQKCMCDRQMFCKSGTRSSPTPQPHVLSETSLPKDLVTLVPSTIVITPELTTKLTTNATMSPNSWVQTTIAATSEMPAIRITTSTKASSTFVPTTMVKPSEINSTLTTSSTEASGNFVPTTMVTTSEINSTLTTSSKEASSTFVPITMATTSELPNMVAATTAKASSTFVSTTKVRTSEMPTTVTASSTMVSGTFVPATMFETSNNITSATSITTSMTPIDYNSPVVNPETLSINTDPWLHSGRCGPHHPLLDGRTAQCNPQGEHPCCNPNSGWCGSTSGHCACNGCVDYRDPWVPSGRCGSQHLLPNGQPGQCNPRNLSHDGPPE